MTQEEKDLLLSDISARARYHVILHFDDKVQQEDEYFYGMRENGGKFLINDAYYIEEVKPYLRPMSSMTEEEKKEFENLLEGIIDGVERWDKPDMCEECQLPTTKVVGLQRLP